jgi:hypothetical protein
MEIKLKDEQRIAQIDRIVFDIPRGRLSGQTIRRIAKADRNLFSAIVFVDDTGFPLGKGLPTYSPIGVTMEDVRVFMGRVRNAAAANGWDFREADNGKGVIEFQRFKVGENPTT